MKLYELKAKLEELSIEGHDYLPVYFRESSPVAFPIVDIKVETLLLTPNPGFNPNIVSLIWRKDDNT
jgi:hypothetical protein